MKTSGELRKEGLFRTADAVELIELVEAESVVSMESCSHKVLVDASPPEQTGARDET